MRFPCPSQLGRSFARVTRYDRGMVVYTIGHSTRSLDELVAILREAEVARIVDVRAFPMSRRHPQFNKDSLSGSLAAAGIDYRHMPALGGRRGAKKGASSRNGLWRV